MANRRISELQEIAGIQLSEDDLLTVVDVGEVDPAIKNKKLTISGTKEYINIYFVPRTGGTVSGSLLLTDNLTVQDQVTASGLNVTFVTNLGSLNVSGAVAVTGTLSGTSITGTNVNATNVTTQSLTTTSFSVTTLTGISGTFTTIVSGATVTGNTGNFGNLAGVSGVFSNYLRGGTVTGDFGAFGTITGATGIFTNSVSGVTFTGTTANFTTGNFQVLNAGSHTITGNLTVTGDLIVRGSGFFSSGIQVTGTVSGTTITGTSAQFTSVTGVDIIGTTQVSGGTVTGGLGQFTTLTGGSAGFTTVTGQTVTGTTGSFTTLNAITAFFTTGVVRENITVTGNAFVNSDLYVQGSGFFSSGIRVTGTVSGAYITGATGAFPVVTGTTFTGTFINATSGVFGTQVSGLNVTGQYARFLSTESIYITGADFISTRLVSGVTFQGSSGLFSLASGGNSRFTIYSGVSYIGTEFIARDISATGIISSVTVTGTTAQFTTGIFTTLVASSHTVTGNLTVSGNLSVRGSGYFSSGIQVTGTLSGTTITGTTLQTTSVTGVSGVFTAQVSGTTVTGNLAQFTTLTGGTAGFTIVTGTTVTGNTVQATTGVFGTVSGASFVAGGATFVTGSGDVRPRGLFSFPTTVGTSGYILQTNADGSTSWAIQSSGGYNGGNFTIYSGDLSVSGSGYFSSGIQVTGTVSGGSLRTATGVFNSGTVANPAITFVNDVDTGIYSNAANNVSVVIGGSSGITISSGTYGMVLTIWAT